MTLVLIGGGGHAGSVVDVVRSAGLQLLGILTPSGAPPAHGLIRLGDDKWLENAPPSTDLHLAFGPQRGSTRREALFDSLEARGFRLPVIIAGTAIVSPSATVGAGSILMHGAFVNSSTRIGRNCIINTRAVVEHDCHIGDHTHVAPGVVISGGVEIGRRCLIGAGAVLLPGIKITDGTVIGAGAVVVRAVETSGETWSGNPARRHL